MKKIEFHLRMDQVIKIRKKIQRKRVKTSYINEKEYLNEKTHESYIPYQNGDQITKVYKISVKILNTSINVVNNYKYSQNLLEGCYVLKKLSERKKILIIKKM